MHKSTREIKEDLIAAGKEAAIDLTTVAKQKILINTAGKDPLAADKMKTAAAAKRLAIFDAFDILDKVQLEEDKLKAADKEAEDKINNPEGAAEKVAPVKIKTDFERPEERT